MTAPFSAIIASGVGLSEVDRWASRVSATRSPAMHKRNPVDRLRHGIACRAHLQRFRRDKIVVPISRRLSASETIRRRRPGARQKFSRPSASAGCFISLRVLRMASARPRFFSGRQIFRRDRAGRPRWPAPSDPHGAARRRCRITEGAHGYRGNGAGERRT